MNDTTAQELWTRLGCAPTADPVEIRRAYARAVKQIDPDRDPDAFQSLREAFDTLLAQATTSFPAETDTAIAPLIQRIRAHRRAGDTDGAITLVDQFIAGHPPGDPVIAAAGEAIFDAMALERRLSPLLFRHLIDRFDWRDASGPVAHAFPQKHSILLARLEAEEWLDHLRDDIANPDRIAATLLLPAAAKPTLDRTQKERATAILAQLLDHAQFLLDRFDGNSLARLREAIEGPPLLAPVPAPVPQPPPVAKPQRFPRFRRVMRYARYVWIAIFVAGVIQAIIEPQGSTPKSPASEARQVLDSTQDQWVELRPFDQNILVYFTQLVSSSAALEAIHYGLDKPIPDRSFPLPPDADTFPLPIGADVQTYLTAPATLTSVSVQLTYADGTTSPIRIYRLPPPSK